MPSVWQYSKNLIKVSVGVGIVFSAVGMLLLALIRGPSPGPVLLAFGCAELGMGITGYLFVHKNVLEKSHWPVLTGILFLATGISLGILSTMLPSGSTVPGFAGVYICAISASLIITGFVATRPVNTAGLRAVGIGLGIAGLPVFILYGLVPGTNQYMFLSVLPLLLGFELALYASAIKSFRSLENTIKSARRA